MWMTFMSMKRAGRAMGSEWQVAPRAVALMLRGGTSPAVHRAAFSCWKRVGGDVAHVNGRSHL